MEVTRQSGTPGGKGVGSREGEGTSGLCPAVPSSSGALPTPGWPLPDTRNSL